MTSITNGFNTAVNAALLSGFGAALGQQMNFSLMRIALGSMGGGCFQPAAPSFTASMPSEGRANVDLGDGYTLTVNESGSEVVIRDAQGNETRIWGDPHVNVNGQHIGDFYGTTTFQLKNGVKITVETRPQEGAANVTYAEKLTITRGDQALVIDGVSELEKGDLSISMNNNGYAADAATADGLVVKENAAGNGWTSSLTGKAVTQADFNMTRADVQGLVAFGMELGLALGGWLSFGQMAGVSALISAAAERSNNNVETVRPARAWAM